MKLVCTVLGLILLAVAIMYLQMPADQLPGFFPGHEAGVTRIHYKHGMVAARPVWCWWRPAGMSARGNKHAVSHGRLPRCSCCCRFPRRRLASTSRSYFHPEKNDGVVVDVIVDGGSSCTHNFGEGPGYKTGIARRREPEYGKLVKEGPARFVYTPTGLQGGRRSVQDMRHQRRAERLLDGGLRVGGEIGTRSWRGANALPADPRIQSSTAAMASGASSRTSS